MASLGYEQHDVKSAGDSRPGMDARVGLLGRFRIVVESTHDLEFTSGRVVKRFRSWGRGELEREWAGLKVLNRYAPGLAPQPLEQHVEDGVPVIVMTRVSGEPLGAAPLTREQLGALSEILRQMHAAVPAEALTSLPERRSGPAELYSTVCSWIAGPLPDPGPPVSAALRAASSWLGAGAAGVLSGPLAERAFTHADGNLGNFLWDGARCRVVDFEDSGVSDPAYEVADLVEHVSAWLPGLVNGDDLAEALELSDSIPGGRGCSGSGG